VGGLRLSNLGSTGSNTVDCRVAVVVIGLTGAKGSMGLNPVGSGMVMKVSAGLNPAAGLNPVDGSLCLQQLQKFCYASHFSTSFSI